MLSVEFLDRGNLLMIRLQRAGCNA